MASKQETGRAFTLIELLIVVAIIAILAAIAVPNYLDAQVRAKVGRVRSDLRMVGIALETYAIDHRRYPNDPRQNQICWAKELSTPIAYLSTTVQPDIFRVAFSSYTPPALPTTPVPTPVPTPQPTPTPYTTSSATPTPWPSSVYDPYKQIKFPFCLAYAKALETRYMQPGARYPQRPAFFLLSVGPDKTDGPNMLNRKKTWGPLGYTRELDGTGRNTFQAWQYDPSNGTLSNGDLLWHP